MTHAIPPFKVSYNYHIGSSSWKILLSHSILLFTIWVLEVPLNNCLHGWTSGILIGVTLRENLILNVPLPKLAETLLFMILTSFSTGKILQKLSSNITVLPRTWKLPRSTICIISKVIAAELKILILTKYV